MMSQPTIKTFGELKKAGYTYQSIKDELRQNLVKKLQNNEPLFEGIIGYEDTVIPDLERAILSGHNINFLGLRGQAKTRMARQMLQLLDEYVPVVEGSEVHDDPFAPISAYAKRKLEEEGDLTGITWLARSDRYSEKLATPDVSIADIIGDIDPIKAAGQKLALSDDRVINYGIIPRSNRCIFVINELPDLQPRIQVALFNILQEGDVQIRGFKMRLPLDIQFIFTSNPEDYTNRGSIITPLKDRIGSQILTHYPKSVEIAKTITKQEVAKRKGLNPNIYLPEAALTILETIAFEARESEFVDHKSGVSARLSITAFENLLSAAERRMYINHEKNTAVRLTDLTGIIPAITGKIEMVYEGEQEGAFAVAQSLISKAIRKVYASYFPAPDQLKRKEQSNPYKSIVDWFAKDNQLDLLNNLSNKAYEGALYSVSGLDTFVEKLHGEAGEQDKLFLMEFVLHGLAEYSRLSKKELVNGLSIQDLFTGMLSGDDIGKN